MKSVLVITPDQPTVNMFKEKGWQVSVDHQPSSLHEDYDLICFTGGADVSPYLYGEENTHSDCDPARDEYEKSVYEKYVGKIPMVGICRGGQFLNVMNGGSMIQHIDLINGDVKTIDRDGYSHLVRVDHHQGIIRDSKKSYSILARDIDIHPSLGPGVGLTYACWYPATNCLCFQPHPEWGHKPTHDLFFQLIEEYIG